MASSAFTSHLPRASLCALIHGLLLLSLGSNAWSQPGEDLSDLVFEPVLLSTVAGLPIDFEQPGDRTLEALRVEAVRLEEVVQRQGNEEADLIQRLESLAELGVIYQRLDRHEDALASFDAAIALTISNDGRRNLRQIPLLEQKLPSHLVLRELSEIDDIEDLIYELKADTYAASSRDMYFATINLADWHTAAYFLENYRVADGRGFARLRSVLTRNTRDIRTPGSRTDQRSDEEIRIADTGGLNAILSGEARGVSTLDIIDPRLRRIDRLYTTYQNAMAETGTGEFDIAIDIAKRIARLAHLTKQEMDYERDNFRYDPDYEGSLAQALRTSDDRMDESYQTGRQALEHMLTLLRSAGSLPPEAIAAGLLDLGDWHLTYGHVPAAKEAYREAWDTLIDAGFSGANINRALAAPMPLRIPLFATHLYSPASAGLGPAADPGHRGYVDIAFTVDELGNAVSLRFLGNSGGETKRIEDIIETQFRSIKFRPTFRDGELHSTTDVELRFNFAY